MYKPIADGIGVVDGPLVYMTYPGLRFLKVPFPTRMTVVKLPSGGLWLHSPIAFDRALAAALSAMGPIRHLVSPNKIHYVHIRAWKDAFPEAIAWASPGVRERARAQAIPVAFDADLARDAPESWEGSLKQTIIHGGFMDEVAFFHLPSRTLILADGIENFELDKIKQPYRFLVWATGANHPHGQMPIDLRSTFWPKKREVRAAVEEMMAWKPERIIVSHGRCIESDAVGSLRFAFRWAL
ncbi:DUF4336 domain-containing protein [Methylocystis sp. IM4]|uniref:DUF4336 domain-containing protein n=1 Tax=Methylocystis sp. IM4 TaxID=3136560 RepID=UPI0031193AAC